MLQNWHTPVCYAQCCMLGSEIHARHISAPVGYIAACQAHCCMPGTLLHVRHIAACYAQCCMLGSVLYTKQGTLLHIGLSAACQALWCILDTLLHARPGPVLHAGRYASYWALCSRPGMALQNIIGTAQLTQFPDSPGMLCLWCLAGSMNASPEWWCAAGCGAASCTLHQYCSYQQYLGNNMSCAARWLLLYNLWMLKV